MKKRKNFRKRKPKDERKGLSVTVYNNNVEGALKVFKRKVKDSNILHELREKQYYTKPSEERREKKNRAKRRNYYQRLRDEKSF